MAETGCTFTFAEHNICWVPKLNDICLIGVISSKHSPTLVHTIFILRKLQLFALPFLFCIYFKCINVKLTS